MKFGYDSPPPQRTPPFKDPGYGPESKELYLLGCELIVRFLLTSVMTIEIDKTQLLKSLR